MSKYFILLNHQSKGNAFIDALLPHFSQKDRLDYSGVSFVLTDSDVLAKQAKLEKMKRAGINRFFVYPHAARPSLSTEFYPSWPHTTAAFAVNDHHIEVMRKVGRTGKILPVGWHLCPIRPFQPRRHVRHVLFAPIHPRNSHIDRDVNLRTFEILRDLAETGEIYLTIRYIAPLDGNGIPRFDHKNISYVVSNGDPAWVNIDSADLVVSHQTFAYLAVARGVPTVMMGEDLVPHVEHRNGDFYKSKNWENYKDMLMYPLDILAERDTKRLFERAISSDVEICTWRERMIGHQFEPEKFVQLIKTLL